MTPPIEAMDYQRSSRRSGQKCGYWVQAKTATEHDEKEDE